MVSPGLAVISVTLNFISSPPVSATILAPPVVLVADVAGGAFGAAGCCAATCVIATGRLRVRSAARQDRVISKVLNLKIETKCALSRSRRGALGSVADPNGAGIVPTCSPFYSLHTRARRGWTAANSGAQ